MRKGSAIVMILIMTIISLISVARIIVYKSWPSEGTFTEKAETAIASSFPGKNIASSFFNGLRYISGARTFDGTYIGNDGSIIKDMEKPSTRTLSTSRAILSSYASLNRNSFFCLIPTSANILQQETDEYLAEEIFLNQRKLISDIYEDFDEEIHTVDVYQTLFSKRNEYIFYHTENGPTSLGGFYIYSELCRGMGITPRPLSAFSTAFKGYGYYGSLCTDSIKRYATSDFVSLYYTDDNSSYSVTHYGTDDSAYTMNGLFEFNEENVENCTDMVMGGLSAVTKIQGRNGYEKLLVFCDGTGKSWLPFMAEHFSEITIIDIDSARDEMIENIEVGDFDKTVFVYSVDNYSRGIEFEKIGIMSYDTYS